MLSRAIMAVGCAALTAFHVETASAQIGARRAETIAGRVVTDSGAPIPGADVIVTMAPDREVFRTTTDSLGRYRMHVENGTGDYLGYATASGYQPFRKRLLRVDTSDVIAFDAVLKSGVQEIQGVTVQAARPRPSRTPEFGPRTGSAEQSAGTVGAGIDPFAAGDVNALAGSIPGLIAGPEGVSALATGPEQTQVTLDGLGFDASLLPRDMRGRLRASTTAYDPAIGGFSGAQLAVELRPGGAFSQRSLRGSVDSPVSRGLDAVARESGTAPNRLALSVAGDGELVYNKWFYNAGLQLRHATREVTPLDAGPWSTAAAVGIDSAAIASLLMDATRLGLPLAGNRRRDGATEVGALVRLDRTPTGRRAFGVTGAVNLAEAPNTLDAPWSTSSQASARSSRGATLRSHWSALTGGDRLIDVRSGFSFRARTQQPRFLLPAAHVLFTGAPDEPQSGAEVLRIGGASLGASDQRRLSWEGTGDTRWFLKGTRTLHQVRLFSQVRVDHENRTFDGNSGTFAFASPDEFAAGRASTFVRLLGQEHQSASVVNGAVAIGDAWSAARWLSVLYGARLDAGTWFAPGVPDLDDRSSFRLASGRSPLRAGVSPRLGFRWTYAGARATAASSSSGGMGTIYRLPEGELRGGVGLFRNIIDASPIAGSLGVRRGQLRQLRCVEDAVPELRWGSWISDPAQIPVSCVDGEQSGAPPRLIRGLADDYAPPQSWRANLGWSTSVGGASLFLEGVVSANQRQPSLVDRNLGDPAFAIAAESGRPVFSPAASIDAKSGAHGRTSVIDPALAHVMTLESSGRSDVVQMVATATGPSSSRYFVRASGVWTASRFLQSGYDAPAGGDPRERTWAPGTAPRLRGIGELAMTRGTSTYSIFARAASGARFAPIVLGDVNGDGYGMNDLAFIYPLDALPDTNTRAELARLTRSAPDYARRCITSQVGRIASRASCVGPASFGLDAQARFAPRAHAIAAPGGGRVELRIHAANVLSGADQLLNGSAMKGWGGGANVDPVLFIVTGFDSASMFHYAVNPGFGRRSPIHGIRSAPFRLTLDVSIFVGRSIPEQQLDRSLRPGRRGAPGQRLTAEALRQRYARSVPDAFGEILTEGDSLLLQRNQTEALQELRARYVARSDTVWSELADYLAALPDVYDAGEALRRQESAVVEVRRIAWEEARALGAILTPVQLALMPAEARWLYGLSAPPASGVRYIAR